ncbi:hypothetical protein M5362_13080 [Streptomyces sp. Je 1-79]|uniref:hypothetical protein n=1 Tax=Streptomyces sp. Je 1-79 TaxID=2943847 RepID=UPI0021A8B1C4|nr:hypothetical protein [Streptomyces sp. Je 1-79]MCT4354064.1 hypothetical protein [Streptomyces sp. Je 1-79]
MSEEKQPAPKPELTPQEKAQQEDQEQIQTKHAVTDMVERLDDIFPVFGGGGSGSVFGKTAFDGRKLNEMLDFLDSANPADLEEAGKALKKATTALNDAAKDLGDFVSRTEWKGEAATEFQRYGSEVVSYAWGIGKLANAVGTQMTVASTGLTSVRNAKPPRDTRIDQRQPKDFPLPEQTEDNPKYKQALQVEKDRQEAINQMNRLASFYAVSQSTLQGQEIPKPPESYKAAVPLPSGGFVGRGTGSETSVTREDLSRASSDPSSPSEARTGDTRPGTDTNVREEAIREPDTKVQIDTVKTTPAPPTTLPTTPPTAPPVTQNPTGPLLPPTVSLGTPPRTGGPRATGTPGVPRTTTGPTAVGRPGGPTSSPAVGRPGGPTSSPAVGRPGGPMAKAGGPPATAQSTQAGRTTPQVGRPGGPGMPGGTAQRQGGGATRQSPIVGRPTGTGQPVTGRTSGGPTTGRSNPIVGGSPQRTSGGNPGSRLPKGTVVGSDGPAAGRTSAARPSQAGVVGANSGNTGARPVGRGTPSTNGVVGSPRGAGAPVGGGRGNQRPARDDQDREGSTRPDYLTEDEETWTNRRRGAVPPVID